MATITVKRLERVLRQMFDTGVDAMENAERASDLRMFRKELVADAIKYMRGKGYLKVTPRSGRHKKYRCVNGHDRCFGGVSAGPECPTCEVVR